MKLKTIIPLIIAILMVSSIVSAGTFVNLGTALYNRIAPQVEGKSAQSGIQTITNIDAAVVAPNSACRAQSDCPGGNCACRCAQRPAGSSGQQTPPPATGSSGATTTPKPNGQACAAASECESGYCNANRVCASCTLNSQCGTGKACIIARPNEGICAAAAAGGSSGSGTRVPGLNLNLPTGRAIDLGGLKLQPGTGSSGTLTTGGSAGTPALPSNGAVCTSASQCTSKICKLQPATTTAAARKVCSTTCSLSTDCETGKTCSSGRCAAPSALRTEGQSCSATAPCASGLNCDSARRVCVRQTAPRTEGQACSAAAPCATGLTCTNSVCTRPAADTGGSGTGADAGTIGSCQAACVETCRLECTPSGEQTPPPATGIKRIGEVCSSPTGCTTECETGYGDCRCEAAGVGAATGGNKEIGEECSNDGDCKSGRCQIMTRAGFFARVRSGPSAVCAEPLETDLEIGEQCYTHSQCKSTYCNMAERVCAPAPAAPKQPLGERCVNNEDCESSYCSTDPETLRKTCAEQAAEVLSPEVQREVRANLDTLEPKIERMEQQVVADGLVASREELVALSGRPECYAAIDDVELKAECLKLRFETVTTLLESKGAITAEQARNWKSRVGGQGAGQERREEAPASPPPQARRTFTERVRNVFRFTGSFWRITGREAQDTSRQESGTDPSQRTREEAPRTPASYLPVLDTQYTELAQLETTICSSYPAALPNLGALKSCSSNTDCTSVSGALKCVSGKCRVNKDDVCTVGEFGGSETPLAPDLPPAGGDVPVSDVTPPPAEITCSSPMSFNVIAVCRGTSKSAGSPQGAFMNITVRNTGGVDIPSFAIKVFELDGSLGPRQEAPMLAAGRTYTQKVSYSTAKYDVYKRLRLTPKIGAEQCNDLMQLFGDVRTDLPKCNGEACTRSTECKTGYCKQEGAQKICSLCRTNSECGPGKTCAQFTGECR